MALPNNKISTTLVANTLGTSSRDVGTLCTHQAINKWSKWKPIRVNKNGAGIILQDLINARFGIGIPSYTSLESLRIAYASEQAFWRYQRPRGTQYNEGYRIGDFRNYEHNAVSPMGGYHVSPEGFTEMANTKIGGSMLTNTGSNPYEVTFSDLTDGLDYIGLALFNQFDQLVRSSVNPTPKATTVELDLASPQKLADGEYKAIMFLSANVQGTAIYSLDNFPNEPFKVMIAKNIASQVVTNLTASYNDLMNSIYGGLTMVNNSASETITLEGVEFRLRYNDKAWGDPMTQGEQADYRGTVEFTPLMMQRGLLFSFDAQGLEGSSYNVWFRCTGTFARTQYTAVLVPMG